MQRQRTAAGRHLAALPALVLAAACVTEEPRLPLARPPAGACVKCERPKPVAFVDVPDLPEASGIAASADHPGVFYVHNDSGASPLLHAIDRTGAWRGTWTLRGARARDWEDLARGPCPEGGSCLYVGDIGNNLGLPRDGVVYVAREPERLDRNGGLDARALPFRYPEGFPDAETLLVDPRSGAIYVVTKEARGPATLYELPRPLRFGERSELVRLGLISTANHKGQFTAGDLRPDGRALVLRTYSDAHWWPLPNGTPADAIGVAPCELPGPREPQGEALAFTADGSGYVTVSEGQDAPLLVARCGAARPAARSAR